jgi:hypothetical protein
LLDVACHTVHDRRFGVLSAIGGGAATHYVLIPDRGSKWDESPTFKEERWTPYCDHCTEMFVRKYGFKTRGINSLSGGD